MLFCIGIGGLLLISCGETSEVNTLDPVAVTRDITAEVLSMQSIDTTPATRAMTAAEKEIKTAYVVQFNGTAAGSTAVWVSTNVAAQLKNGGFIKCDFTLSGTRSRVYVIANPKTTPTVNMTLAAFETVTYSVSTLPATGLPMAASQDVIASDALSVFQLKSPLAKLTFTANMGILSLRGIPSAYSLVPAVPGNNPVRPAGITYTATATLTSGTAYYVPANLSGTVDMADHTLRCSLFAPANSMYVVNTANGTTYNTYLGSGTASDFNVVSNCAYTIAANAYLSDGSDLRVGTPTITALDTKGTANCYLVPGTSRWYSFNAKVMGNGATTPAHTVGSISGDIASPAITPTPLSPTSVEVLWETVNTTSAPVKGTVVSSVILSNGRVSFRAGTVPGNAVIAVKSGSTILWSWHLWRLNETPKEIGLNAIGTLTADNELVMMDRNLGALSAATGSDLSIGLLYQWGRKDPMPGGATLSSASTVIATTLSGIPNIAAGGASVTLATAVANPTTFYTNGTDPCDWTTRNDNLWGTPLTEQITISPYPYNSNKGNKSMYDPCPVGWRVAPAYVFANASTSNGGTFNRGYSFTIGSGNAAIWFPVSGYRNYGNGSLVTVGANGLYWTASPYVGTPAGTSYLNFNSGNVRPSNDYSYRGCGSICRCVRG